MVFHYGEGDQAIAVAEFVFGEDFLEEGGHLFGRVAEGSAAEGAENQGVVAVTETHPEDGSYLVGGYVFGFFAHLAVRGQLDLEVAPEVEGGAGDYSALVGLLHKATLLSFAENCDGGGVDYAVAEVGERVVGARLVRVAESLRVILREGEDGAAEGAAAADGLFLGPCSANHVSARMSAAREVEKGGIVALLGEASCRLEAVVFLHDYPCALGKNRGVGAGEFRVDALFAVKRFLEVGELDAGSGRCCVVAVFDCGGCFLENCGVAFLYRSDRRVVISSIHNVVFYSLCGGERGRPLFCRPLY